jgi:tetratricopeptide (TPR) repeat protein
MMIPGSDPQNYRLLETTRAFSREKLAQSMDRDSVRRRHAHFILGVLERATYEWETTPDRLWLKRYVLLIGDLRNALNWAGGQDSDDAVALAGASWPLWLQLSLLVEGRSWLSSAQSRLRPDTAPILEARLRIGLGALLNNNGPAQTAHDEFARAVDLYRMLGARPLLGAALSRLAFALLSLGRLNAAEQTIAESIAILEKEDHPRTLATAYAVSACVEASLNRCSKARAISEKAAKLCEETGAERTGFVVRVNLVEFSMQLGDFERAIAVARELVEALRNTFHSDVLGNVMRLLVGALTENGDVEEALAIAREAVPLLRDDGQPVFDHLALRAALAGKSKDAARIIGYADCMHRAFSRPREPIEKRAAARVLKLLRGTLPEGEIKRLKREGAALTEQRAIDLALEQKTSSEPSVRLSKVTRVTNLRSDIHFSAPNSNEISKT